MIGTFREGADINNYLTVAAYGLLGQFLSSLHEITVGILPHQP